MQAPLLRRCLLIAALLCGAVFLAWQWHAKPLTAPMLPHEAAGYLVNVNTASVAELAALPAIGPQMAQKIVAARAAAKEPWRSVEEMDIKGIGPATRAKIAPFVRF